MNRNLRSGLALLVLCSFGAGCGEATEVDDLESSEFSSIQSAVRGGSTTSGKEWIANMRVRRSNNWSNSFCGATLIADNWLVTAAHCTDFLTQSDLDHKDVRVCLGESDQRSCPKAKRATVKKIIKHPKWQPGNFKRGYDIALLKVRGSKFDQFQKRKIATRNDEPSTGGSANAFGWGIGDVGLPNAFLQKLKYDRASNVLCDAAYNINMNRFICMDSSATEGVCSGDSGGPLVRKGKLVGITSFGALQNGVCTGVAPDAFTRVSSFRTWIMETIKD